MVDSTIQINRISDGIEPSAGILSSSRPAEAITEILLPVQACLGPTDEHMSINNVPVVADGRSSNDRPIAIQISR